LNIFEYVELESETEVIRIVAMPLCVAETRSSAMMAAMIAASVIKTGIVQTLFRFHGLQSSVVVSISASLISVASVSVGRSTSCGDELSLSA
jgi:hypothetical protein